MYKMANGNTLHWYVLRVTYQRELSTKKYLDRMGIENFVPLRPVRQRNAHGRFFWTTQAALHNYIFVRATRETIDELKTFHQPALRYVMHIQDGHSQIMVVPDAQMRSFIAVAGNTDERILFLEPADVDLSEGDRVRVTGGLFDGVEGVLMRIGKSKGRHVVVKIEGIAAVATASVPMALIEKI